MLSGETPSSFGFVYLFDPESKRTTKFVVLSSELWNNCSEEFGMKK